MAKKKMTDPPNSPITVGGGGDKKPKRKVVDEIYIGFDHDDYIANGNVYGTPILALAAVMVNGSPVPGVNANSEVEIQYKKTLSHKIIINEDGEMGVEFKKDHYPYNYGTKLHHGANCEFKKLKVDGQEVPVDTSRPYVIECHTRLKRARKR